MVPDLSAISRRQTLASLGGGLVALTGGTVAIGATEPTALPDPVTDVATKHYPTPPEVSTLWQPTVTEAHAREAVELLADTATESERLWEDLDEEADSAPLEIGDGGWLEDARASLANGNYQTAVFRARYGIQFAGEGLGYAKATNDQTDWATLTERGRSLATQAQSVASDLKPYPTVSPGRDLGWYVRIEQELQAGSIQADRVLPDEDEKGSGSTETERDSIDPSTAGEMTAALLQAEINVRTAKQYHDLLAEKLTGETVPYADHLKSVSEQFRTELAEYPTQGEVESNYIDDDVDRYGPWEFAHSRLARWCFDLPIQAPWERELDQDLIALQTVAASIGLAKRRGHETAVERLVVDEDDTDFDSGHTLAEKRRARTTYQSVVGDDPSPLLATQIGRAVEDLQVAKVGFLGEYTNPMWRERLKPYLYALIGRAKLAEYPGLRDEILEAGKTTP